MASDRIFFGSLERQERNRMVDENREETASIASKTTQVNLKQLKIKLSHKLYYKNFKFLGNKN